VGPPKKMGCASSTPSPAEKPTEEASGEVQESSAPGRSIKRRLSQVQQERHTVLGENKFLSRADTLITGVLPLANAFDHFDSDKTSSLSVEELQDALSHLGIESNSETARRILKQYDSYNDGVIDVKEFATIVRDIKLMIAFDANGDGVIDADELLPLLKSLGLNVDMDGVQQIMQRFDVDRNGSIDLVELSSIVRTAQAFVRYDTDGSGAIEIDELRDALRKLGLKAGALEEQALFSRYDTDGNQALE
jgi:Ca2+-binding EF-hand superfamily protein